MKTRIKFLFLGVLMALFCSISCMVYADDPNPPTVPGDHGHAGDVPVGAPIDGGLFVLLILGAGYGAKKIYSLRKEKEDGLKASL